MPEKRIQNCNGVLDTHCYVYIYIYIYEHSRWAEVAHRIAILCASTEPKALSLHFVSTGHANDCTADATPQTCITLLASDKHQITRLGTVAGLPAGLLDNSLFVVKYNFIQSTITQSTIEGCGYNNALVRYEGEVFVCRHKNIAVNIRH